MRRELRRSYRRWRRAIRDRVDDWRGRLGLARMQRTKTFHLRPDRIPDKVVEAEGMAFDRMLPYLWATAAFAVLILGVFWGYAAITARSDTEAAHEAQGAVTQAIRHLREGDLETARQLRASAASAGGEVAAVDLLDGYLMAAEGRADEVEAAVAQGGLRGARRARALVRAAGAREFKRDLGGALAAVKEAARLDADDPGIGLLHARALLKTGQPQEAVLEAARIDAASGAGAETLLIRGRAYLEMGMPARAREQFSSALLYSGNLLPARLGLADAYMRLNRDPEALEQVSLVLAGHPDEPEANLRLAMILERAGDFDAAAAAYKSAVDAQSQNHEALNNWAYMLSETQGKHEQALPLARKAYEAAPHDPAVADTLGWILHQLGRSDEALPLLRQAHEGLPESAEVRKHWEAVSRGSSAAAGDGGHAGGDES